MVALRVIPRFHELKIVVELEENDLRRINRWAAALINIDCYISQVLGNRSLLVSDTHLSLQVRSATGPPRVCSLDGAWTCRGTNANASQARLEKRALKPKKP
jgi:hypothetical protein